MHLGFLNHDTNPGYNSQLAKKLGSVKAAIFLCELIGQMEFHSLNTPHEMIANDEGCWFYYTVQCGIDRLAMTPGQQNTAIKILLSKELIKKRSMKSPPKRFFCINEDKILDLLDLSKNVSRICDLHKVS